MNQEEYESVVHNQHLKVNMLPLSASSARLRLPAFHLRWELLPPQLSDYLKCLAKLHNGLVAVA